MKTIYRDQYNTKLKNALFRVLFGNICVKLIKQNNVTRFFFGLLK